MFLINNQYFKLAKEHDFFYAKIEDVFDKKLSVIVKLTPGEIVRLTRLFFILSSKNINENLLKTYLTISSLVYIKTDGSYFTFNVSNKEINVNYETISGAYYALNKTLNTIGILNHIEEETEKWQVKVYPDNVKIYKTSINDTTTEEDKIIIKERIEKLSLLKEKYLGKKIEWKYPYETMKMDNQKIKDIYGLRYVNASNLLEKSLTDGNMIEDYYISLKLLAEIFFQIKNTVDEESNDFIQRGEILYKHKNNDKGVIETMLQETKRLPLEESLKVFYLENVLSSKIKSEEKLKSEFVTRDELKALITDLKKEIIDKLIPTNKDLSDITKEIMLYYDGSVKITYDKNMYKLICGEISTSLYLDELYKFSLALSDIVNKNESQSIRMNNSIVTFTKLANNNISVKQTDSNLNEKVFEIQSYSALTLPTIIDRLTNFSALYSTLNKNRYLYVEEPQVGQIEGIQQVKVENETYYIESEEPLENGIDDNKIPINIWSPYSEGFEISLLQQTEHVNEFVSFISLMITVEYDKIDNVTLDMFRKYISNVVQLKRDTSIQTLKNAHTIIKKFLSDPRPLDNNISLRRKIRKFKNYPVIQTIMYMVKNSFEDIDKFILLTGAYYIASSLEDDLEVQ